MLGVFCARSSNFNVANKHCIHSNSLPDASVQNKLFGYLSIKCYSVHTAISLRVYEQKCYINVVRFLTCSNLCTKKKCYTYFVQCHINVVLLTVRRVIIRIKLDNNLSIVC